MLTKGTTTSWKLHVTQHFNTSTKSITFEMPRRQALVFSANVLDFPTFDERMPSPLCCHALISQARLMIAALLIVNPQRI